jgi:general secretion pathway protein A
MFHDFYQMLEEPFSVSPDPRFLYLAASHREALASLFYGIESGRGFMVLIAPPGCGKTTLIHQLVGKIKPSARTVFLFQTQCSSSEMLQYLLNDLGVDIQGMEKVAMHNRLQQILTQERLAGRRFVLIVDEAQNLEPEVLETIRLLSNFETSQQKLVQILLVGQPQLAHKLASRGLDQLQQRISICAKLQPFHAEETAGYIAHRLKVAGYSGEELFTPEAMSLIKDRSRGIPRNINRLCFAGLSLGYAMGRNQVDAEMMREVSRDLDGKPGELDSPPPLSHVGGHTAPAMLTGRSHSMLRNWKLNSRGWGVTGLAATVLIALAWLEYAPVRMESSLPEKSRVAAPMKKPVPSVPVSAEAGPPSAAPAKLPAQPGSDTPSGIAPATAKTVVMPELPSVNEGAVPRVDTRTLNAKTDDTRTVDAGTVDIRTVKVVVRPGETLQRIALRTLGQDSNQLIRRIQELNPRLKNPDHIEADQEIRLPQVPPETMSVPQ